MRAPADMLDIRLRTMQLVHDGALIRMTGAGAMLVGELRWWPSSTIAWFPAFADRTDDARVFTFDQVRKAKSRIAFCQEGAVVAELMAISVADVEDPDDYLIGWRLWLEVIPLRRAFIESCFEQIALQTGNSASGSNSPFSARM